MATLLFCEDEERVRRLIRYIMRSTEYKILIAVDGIEGLAVVERERPDIIFMDISMPNRDGFQLADIVKNRSELAHIPIVFVTAFAQRSEVEEGYRHGALDYLVKPFSPAELRAKIIEIVRSYSRGNIL